MALYRSSGPKVRGALAVTGASYCLLTEVLVV